MPLAQIYSTGASFVPSQEFGNRGGGAFAPIACAMNGGRVLAKIRAILRRRGARRAPIQYAVSSIPITICFIPHSLRSVYTCSPSEALRLPP